MFWLDNRRCRFNETRSGAIASMKRAKVQTTLTMFGLSGRYLASEDFSLELFSVSLARLIFHSLRGKPDKKSRGKSSNWPKK